MVGAVKKKPGLIAASGIMFAMIMVGNVCNYLFHAISSRMLGPADYGALVSMLAVVSVMVIGSQAIQAVVAKKIAVEELVNRHDRIWSMVLASLWRSGIFAFSISLFLWVTAFYWVPFFKLDSWWPIFAVGVATIVSLLLPVGRGLLQGLQRFGWLGFNIMCDGVLRMAVAGLLFFIGWRVTGGVLAAAVSGTVALFFTFWPNRKLVHEKAVPFEELEFKKLYQYGAPVFVAFGSLAVLASLDVILVKHYFEPVEAGFFSAASVVGKAFLFLPLAIAQVLFPKASAGHALEEDTLGLLHRSLGMTLITIIAGIGVVWLMPQFIVGTLFGKEFVTTQTLELVKYFAVAICPLALVYILVQYNLAVHHTRFAWLMLGAILFLGTGIVLFHATLIQTLVVVGCSHFLLLVSGYIFTIQGVRHGQH